MFPRKDRLRENSKNRLLDRANFLQMHDGFHQSYVQTFFDEEIAKRYFTYFKFDNKTKTVVDMSTEERVELIWERLKQTLPELNFKYQLFYFFDGCDLDIIVKYNYMSKGQRIYNRSCYIGTRMHRMMANSNPKHSQFLSSIQEFFTEYKPKRNF